MQDDNLYNLSFLERLVPMDHNRSVVCERDIDSVGASYDHYALLGSIKRNIMQLLNSRLGESLSSPRLGLVDFNDATLGSYDLIWQIKSAISSCLTSYEPRLTNYEIYYVAMQIPSLQLHFYIKAEFTRDLLATRASKATNKVQIDLLLDANRRYIIM